MDVVKHYLLRHKLGRVERRFGLSGRLELTAGGQARPELLLTSSGLWLVGATSPDHGRHTQVLGRPDFSLHDAGFHKELRLGTERFSVSPLRFSELLRLVARARLCTHPARHFNAEAVHVEAPGELERQWLASELGPEEVLLCWLQGQGTALLPEGVLQPCEGKGYFLVTSERVAFVALSAAGDAWVVDGPEPPAWQREGKKLLATREFEWIPRRRNLKLAEGVLRALQKTGDERLLSFARLNFLDRGQNQARAELSSALVRKCLTTHPLAPFIYFLLQHESRFSTAEAPLAAAIAGLEHSQTTATALSSIWSDWGFSPAAGFALLAALRACGGAETWALSLHRSLSRTPETADARHALDFAEHLISQGKFREAKELVSAKLGSLDSEALEDLLPPQTADLTRGAGGQALRIRALSLLRDCEQDDDLGATAELARLQPLVKERVQALSERAPGALRERAEQVLARLSPGGLIRDQSETTLHAQSSPPSDTRPGRRLPAELTRGPLRHPLARPESPWLDWFQAMLAAVPAPDHALLKDYCERLSTNRYPDAARSFDHCKALLGLHNVQVYVSRGQKSVGVRGYEATPSFVLIGGRHLEPDGPFFMTADELSFAFGAELLHLQSGHTRVTSSEVWAGALTKTREGLDLALSVLPLFRGYKLAGRANRLVSRLPSRFVYKALEQADRLGLFRPPPLRPNTQQDEDVLSRINEELIAAHRVMQLTADRAGLVLCGDLKSALRAIMLVRADYQRLLVTAEKEGLPHVLSLRDAALRIRHQDLAIRVAALCSFYLSEEYQRLRRVVGDS